MKIIKLLLKIFVSLILLIVLGLGSFIYYDTVQSTKANQEYTIKKELREQQVLEEFTSGKVCFYIKNVRGYIRELDYEYDSAQPYKEAVLEDAILHYNKIVSASGVEVGYTEPSSEHGGSIDKLVSGLTTVHVTYPKSIEQKGIIDNSSKYMDRYYSNLAITEVPCTFNPFTKEEPKK